MTHWFVADLDILIHATGEMLNMVMAFLDEEGKLDGDYKMLLNVVEKDYQAAILKYNRAGDYKDTLFDLHKIRRDIYKIVMKEDLMIVESQSLGTLIDHTPRRA